MTDDAAFADLIDATGQPAGGAPLGALLTAQARATPDAPALTIGGRTWSFATLDARANRRARQLAGPGGVGPGDRVMIALRNRIEFVEAVFGAWKLGAVPCPASWRMVAEEFAELTALLSPKVVLGTIDLPSVGVPSIDVDVALPCDLPEAPLPPVIVAPNRIVNSGGSTGRPKLIVDPTPSAWGPDKEGRSRPPRTVLLVPGPFYHSAPFAYVALAIAQGCHVVGVEQFDARDWLRLAERHRPGFGYLVPTMMSRIAKLPRAETADADLSSFRTILHMAAPCPVDVKRWWIERLGPDRILEVYGGSERIGTTLITGAEWLEHSGSVGRPVVGEEVLILDEEGRSLPPGEIGEIVFRRAMPPGDKYAYIGADTRIRGDLDGFGDLGRLDADGYLYIADRRTDMVTVGGTNVFPAEIEAAIETLPDVLCAAVIGMPDADMGNRLHAIVELAPDAAEPDDGLAFLAPALARLSAIKRPRSVEFTKERVRDDAGKLRRARLRAERMTEVG